MAMSLVRVELLNQGTFYTWGWNDHIILFRIGLRFWELCDIFTQGGKNVRQ